MSGSEELWTQAREEALRAIELLAYGESRCRDAARHMNEAARLAGAIYPAMVERQQATRRAALRDPRVACTCRRINYWGPCPVHREWPPRSW